MIISEIEEAVVSIFGKKGNKTVRKYRCTSGQRKGRIVSKAATCNAPKSIKKSVSMKKTRAKKGASINVKSQRTKRTNPASRRLSKINTGRRTLRPRSKSKRKRL